MRCGHTGKSPFHARPRTPVRSTGRSMTLSSRIPGRPCCGRETTSCKNLDVTQINGFVAIKKNTNKFAFVCLAKEELMRMTIAALSIASALCLVCDQSASAFPVNTAAIKEAVTASSAVQQAQYYERHTRHRIIKCYRVLIFGPYVCHAFYRW